MQKYSYDPLVSDGGANGTYAALHRHDHNVNDGEEEEEEEKVEFKEEARNENETEDDLDIEYKRGISTGRIAFRGVTRETEANYILLKEGTSAETVWQEMKKAWKMKKPRLVVSVIGGVRPFYLDPRIEANFKAAILKLSHIPDACIITGGAYTGVMKLVGEALEESFSKVCLGISTWNDVTDISSIVDNTKPYVVGSWLANRGLYLDYHHTNFLIVKEARSSDDAQKKFRGALEQYLKKLDPSLPSILLVVNGGFGTLEYVHEYLTKVKSPVVLVGGSGKCADLLLYGHQHWEKICAEDEYDIEHKKLFLEMKKYLIGEDKYDENKERRDVEWKDLISYIDNDTVINVESTQHGKAVGDLARYYKILLECLTLEMFSVAELETPNNIDTAILNGLLAASTSTFEKMKQTLLFNRADMARSYIFSAEPKVTDENLKELMVMALQRGDHEYVKLLMDYGVNMHQVLDAKALESLYGYQLFEDNFLLDKFVENDFESHSDLKWESYEMYKNKPLERKSLPRRVVESMLNFLCHRFYDHKIFIFVEPPNCIDGKLDDPFWDLFLWAAMCNMLNMADFLWPFGRNQMAKALIGAEILKNLAVLDTNQQQATECLKECSEKYRVTAHDLLDELSARNEEDTRKLTTTTLPPHVPTLTCLDMAVKVHDYEFVANSSIQMILWDVWTGPTRTKHVTLRDYLKFMVSIVFPFWIVSSDEMEKEEEEFDGERDEKDRLQWLLVHAVSKKTIDPLWKRLYHFYFSTPIVTFLLHLWGAIIFLVLYSYLVMSGQCAKNDETSWGILLWLYIIGYVLGEFYQICMYDAKYISTKFHSWISDTYNQFDVLNILLYFVAWSYSFYPETLGISHTFHSINCGLWILRFSTKIRVSPNLGLYLEMMTTMLIDLMWFLLILSVFVLAFFVTSSSLLYPGNPISINYFHMFLRSWFSVYGEFFLEIKPDGNATTHLTTPKINSYDEYVVWVIMGIYLLITNLLLFNIIIAAFNTTYSNIQTNSTYISKYRIYDLVVEYSNRVSMPPPLSILHYLWRLMKFIYRCIARSDSPMEPAKKKLRYNLQANERTRLRNFEHYYAIKVWKRKIKEEEATPEVGGINQVFQKIELPPEKISGDTDDDMSGERIGAAGFTGMSSEDSSVQEDILQRMKTIEEHLVRKEEIEDIGNRIDAIGEKIIQIKQGSEDGDISLRSGIVSADLAERLEAMERNVSEVMKRMEENMSALGDRLNQIAQTDSAK